MQCLIVDAYSSGRFLPAALAGLGVKCVHVQSSPALPSYLLRTFPQDAFTECLVHDGDLEALLDAVRPAAPAFVLPGNESGVDLADTLARRLGLPGNAPDERRVRRDKYDMAMAVRAHGLRAPDTLRTSRFDTALGWARAHGRWPLVVKPADSAGTDNVFFCADPVELCTSFGHILSSSNIQGSRNKTVVLQERLTGTEYFANTVSVDGRHHIAEIWRYHKRRGRSGAAIYDYEEPLTAHDPAAAALAPYLLGVLDALGVRWGPAHSEVMLTDEGPVLIETGARLAGSILPHVVSRCFGTNHVELTALAGSDPAAFAARTAVPAEPRTGLRYVSLISPFAGRLTSLDGFERLRELPSYADHHLGVRAGDFLSPTVDSATSPGVCYLLHEDERQIETDYRRLRALELQETGGLYEVVRER
ncbi:ATP-grasp domain-containing protein [Streptomyces paromomycinus]|uniref:Argininosuccinate lyase n=1 Tax=Streptomyces paromomycinus TaxID=92743 RepID=A0A401WB33_STREY|nr:ATP-grasp domain-containing protein [Streptomyces paromomycinus]GCD46534.1 argininosuccinate lyase [Streptomyces paromomycinus]